MYINPGPILCIYFAINSKVHIFMPFNWQINVSLSITMIFSIDSMISLIFNILIMSLSKYQCESMKI